MAPTTTYAPYGTILEAAFVDPAYQWPPPEGEGRNAIELQASVTLLDDNVSVQTTESERARMEMPPKPDEIIMTRRWGWRCCRNNDATTMDRKEYEQAKKNAIKARKEHYQKKKQREKELRKRNKYNRVPEGILIYRLDTANQTLTLMSQPHANTNMDALITEMVICSAQPAVDKSRRGMKLLDMQGNEHTLVACEQRTAISWLEAIDLMLANKGRLGTNVSTKVVRKGIKIVSINEEDYGSQSSALL